MGYITAKWLVNGWLDELNLFYRIFIIKRLLATGLNTAQGLQCWFEMHANLKCEIFCQTVKPGRIYRINSFIFAALSSNRMDSRVLTQMQFHWNEAISCPFSDILIWTNRYPGGNFDTFVIKEKCICLIIFIDHRINHGACSIQQIFVAVPG